MIVDKTEDKGEHAWTKLLDDKDGGSTGKGAKIVPINRENNSLIINMPSNASQKESMPLATEHLLENCDASGVGVDEMVDNTSSNALNDGGGVGDEAGVVGAGAGGVGGGMTRKESLFGTFHKHLRRSLKAVSESPGPITRYRQTRFSSRRVRKRVIFKHGDCNVVQGNVAKRRRRYLQDIFTTLVDAQWRWTLLVFALSFLISWAFFAFIWWTIAYAHGDLEYLRLRETDPQLIQNLTHTMCVTEVRSLTAAFLYSIETQHTIGYGNRFVTEECPEAIFTMCLQCITGVFIQAFMVGIVFAKLSRPKKRAQTLLFSRNAVICHRDGVPCLMFRVGDMRKSHIIEAHVRAQIIRKKVTKEGEILPFYQQELTVGADGGEDRLMFIWPTTIVHKIDRNSPLFKLSATDLMKERFEVVVMLEGVIESTGMTTQARSSYLPTEILWGHRFVNVVSFRKETGEYEVDYTLFNNTYEVNTPLCSSMQLEEVRKEYKQNVKLGLERAFSTGILQHIHSAPSVDCLDPASDESISSVPSQIRSSSIPNGILASELEPLNNNNNNTNNNNNNDESMNTVGNRHSATFMLGGVAFPPLKSTTNLQSINEKTHSGNEGSATESSTGSLSGNGNGTGTITGSSSVPVCTSILSNGNKPKAAPGTRRLSIKQDPEPIDSIC